MKKLTIEEMQRNTEEHGNRIEVAERLKHLLKKVRFPNGFPKGYLRNFKLLSEILLPICKELRRMPSGQELREMGYHLDEAFHNFGGKPKVTKRLGYQLLEAPKNYYKDFSNLEKILLPMCKELGRMPTRSELRERGYHLNKKYKCFGGKNEVAKG